MDRILQGTRELVPLIDYDKDGKTLRTLLLVPEELPEKKIVREVSGLDDLVVERSINGSPLYIAHGRDFREKPRGIRGWTNRVARSVGLQNSDGHTNNGAMKVAAGLAIVAGAPLLFAGCGVAYGQDPVPQPDEGGEDDTPADDVSPDKNIYEVVTLVLQKITQKSVPDKVVPSGDSRHKNSGAIYSANYTRTPLEVSAGIYTEEFEKKYSALLRGEYGFPTSKFRDDLVMLAKEGYLDISDLRRAETATDIIVLRAEGMFKHVKDETGHYIDRDAIDFYEEVIGDPREYDKLYMSIPAEERDIRIRVRNGIRYNFVDTREGPLITLKQGEITHFIDGREILRRRLTPESVSSKLSKLVLEDPLIEDFLPESAVRFGGLINYPNLINPYSVPLRGEAMEILAGANRVLNVPGGVTSIAARRAKDHFSRTAPEPETYSQQPSIEDIMKMCLAANEIITEEEIHTNLERQKEAEKQKNIAKQREQQQRQAEPIVSAEPSRPPVVQYIQTRDNPYKQSFLELIGAVGINLLNYAINGSQQGSNNGSSGSGQEGANTIIYHHNR